MTQTYNQKPPEPSNAREYLEINPPELELEREQSSELPENVYLPPIQEMRHEETGDASSFNRLGTNESVPVMT